MPLPPLVHYVTEQDYRAHFEGAYCRGPITTFDGYRVRFRKDQFGHCFFESVNVKDDTFSRPRAERIDWIGAALTDGTVEMRVGWDNRKKRPAKDRRVAIVAGDFVVIIRLRLRRKAEFVTCFVANPRSLAQIRTNPIWT